MGQWWMFVREAHFFLNGSFGEGQEKKREKRERKELFGNEVEKYIIYLIRSADWNYLPDEYRVSSKPVWWILENEADSSNTLLHYSIAYCFPALFLEAVK